MQKVGFVFPGQGSQKVGMGRSWASVSPAAQAVFDEADRALGIELAGLCWEGPAEDLQRTENTQPAILTTSVAILRAAHDRLPQPVVVAGHSLGEYSALVAAGVLEFSDAVGLVRERGRLMQQAVPEGEGAMAAILGLDAGTVEDLAREASSVGVCAAANFNAPVQTVIAGDSTAVEKAVDLAKARGAKRAVLLPVSAPFHSPLMAPARAGLEPLLAETGFGKPGVPVVNNVDAAPVVEGAECRGALGRQVDNPVRWVESVQRMSDEFEVDTFVEIGPGSVLSGLIRRIVPGARVVSLAEPSGLEKLAEEATS
ncbi:MAG: ACP S-malonyltransferase [bacterium]|nr:ACP S-malonyltransferase [bacterium]